LARYKCHVAGFIVLEDGRAYAASGWATDATLRVIARSVEDEPLRSWLLAQQGVFVGSGLTAVDLRELAPQCRPVMRSAIRDAYHRVDVDGGFEDLVPGQEPGASWIQRLGELVEMLDRSEAGEAPEAFNPHMRQLLPASGHEAGPGWDRAPTRGSAT
jgi:hypothetical protein